ncbi:RNA-directed DNA polymerase (reverse transcriptase)-related family protein [Rhynchospora pubera]|uniref:RNA-directed DNA polymerase (Reverse transcriptase)-related family protein n=1 Tax=Rhynchospora pubera TaxID=906938 RepID=A0AAV8FUZ8_9POAL|nr:RNA-directed DNA polymerase (reverse transcriptase)-related family protein [Rhynchospora pubera]
MTWPFVRGVLLMYGFPEPFVKWIMMCVSSARFSIVFDGHSDGFIQPTSGLRQGCALSPYIFILCMDVLTRMLMKDTQEGRLKGVRLSNNGPNLNALLYADDLLIFGEASIAEVQRIANILDHFCAISGQRIGHNKSRVWFSRATPENMRNFVLTAFNVSKASPSEIYLGSPVNARSPTHFLPLVNKIEGKLQGWKATFLSQAGKITLIKAVVEPMLLHAISTSAIPKSTLDRIQSLVRSFFWSAKDKRKMSLIAWKKMTRPKMEGGLGLRDFSTLNLAFNLKCCWKMASNSAALWAIMNARQVLQQHVTWQLGNGSVCGAFGQPWHSFWTQVNPSSLRQRRLSVSHFLNPSGQWDCGKLIEEFGFAIALFISMSITPPLLGQTRADRLIFTYARNGQFTLKKAYHLVAPEVALPNSPPDLLRPCSLCGFHAETIQHALFKCPWAQSLWFASSLGLHTDDLPENISELLKTVLGSEGEDIARIVANHLWALWKLRCIEVFQGKNATPQSFMALATSYSKLAVDAGLASCRAVGPTPQNCSQSGTATCLVDGSYVKPHSAGWAYLLSNAHGKLLEYGVHEGDASSPLQAEVKAMLHATRAVLSHGVNDCVFHTDCSNLNMVICGYQSAEQLDWRAYHDLLDVLYVFRTNPGFHCSLVPREELVVVDVLAKFARLNNVSYVGNTFPIFLPIGCNISEVE